MPEEGREWSDEEAKQTPVDPERCVFCKVPRHEWDPEVVGYPVEGPDGSEVICSSCHTDLRLYKRVYSVLVLAHDGFGPEAKRVIGRHFNRMLEEIEALMPEDEEATLRPPTDSNAAKGRDPTHANVDADEAEDLLNGEDNAE